MSNVVFANGWVARPNGDVFIYYGSSDTRTHVATTTVEKLLDYVGQHAAGRDALETVRGTALPVDRKKSAAGPLKSRQPRAMNPF